MAVKSLVGRAPELARIDQVLARAPGGGALLLRGDAGIGKSTLLDAAASVAGRRGFRVIRAGGVQSEATLPFAGLQQILHPLAARTAGLPIGHRAALSAAFGEGEDGPPEPYLVALAALGVLCAEAADAPLLLVVDDVHWIDSASADVLAFLARRLHYDPIALVAAARTGHDTALLAAGLPVLELTGLDDRTADRLLRARTTDLDDRARAEILAAARGNPLALVELPLTAGHPAATPHVLPLTERLEGGFAARLDDLDPDIRLTLTVCAADDRGSLPLALAAASRVLGRPVTAALLVPAADARLLTVTAGHVEFRHPLVRSAIYQAAADQDRRLAHAALAAEIHDDPERRAWHLAAGAAGPSESVAAAMEEAARSAAGRGAAVMAAAAWDRAARLTPAPSARAARHLRAAEIAAELGDNARAARHLAETGSWLTGLAERARVALVRDTIEPGLPGDPSRVRTLVGLAREVAASDPGLAARLMLAAAAHTWAADPGADARRDLITAIGKLPGPADDPMRLTMLGFADPGRHAAAIRARVGRIRPDDLDTGASALVTSVFLVGADPALVALQARLIDRLRATGRFRALPHMLAVYAWHTITLADWRTALPAADEGHRIAAETGQPLWAASNLLAQAMIAGWRGDQESAAGLATEAETIALPGRMTPILCGLQLVRGFTAIGAGEYDVAYTHLSRLFDPADPSFHPVQSTWALGDLAEAAIRTDRAGQARALLARFAPAGGVTAAPWTEASVLYARPLLDPSDEAFRAALESSLARWPSYRARVLLEHGTWLRRHRRPVDARGPLRAARDAAHALGLEPWAERARAELRATGEDSQQHTAAAWAVLSPQELQIAQLAAAGHSNREIAERLYLSQRTVASHLYRIYPKLGIKSRAKLHSILKT